MLLIRASCVLLLCLFLPTGCASKPDQPPLNIERRADPHDRIVTVYAASTRTRTFAKSSVLYTADKSFALNYARFGISVPTASRRDAAEERCANCWVAAVTPLTRSQFLTEVSSHRPQHPQAGDPGIGIYVHGFNNTFPESLFRLAQMAKESKSQAVPILFSWPSEGIAAGYGADRDSATYSRDYLTSLLIDLNRGERKGDILLLGHSLGAWVSTEAVRQLKISGHDSVLASLQLVLAAPDIDEGVFRQQMAVIGLLPMPPVVLVTKDDRALDISRLLATNRPRLGSLSAASDVVRREAVREGVQIVDISQLTSNDSLNHDRYERLAEFYRELMSQRNTQSDLKKSGTFDLSSNVAITPASSR